MPTSPLLSAAAALGSLVVPFSRACNRLSAFAVREARPERAAYLRGKCASGLACRANMKLLSGQATLAMAISQTERVRVIEPGRTYLGEQGFT